MFAKTLRIFLWCDRLSLNFVICISLKFHHYHNLSKADYGSDIFVDYGYIGEVDRLTGQKTKYSGTTYDAGSRVMMQTDVFGNTTRNTYGFDGKLATTTNSKNQTYSYSSTTVTVTDPLGRKKTSVSLDYYVPTETMDYPTRVVDIGGNDR
jgi:hypothetical protein